MRDNRGFTLIELLIVIVILCILAAMAIPKISNSRDKSHFTHAKSSIKDARVSLSAQMHRNHPIMGLATSPGA